MFTVNGTWNGKKTSVTWDHGDVDAPETFVAALEDLANTVTSVPVPLVLDHPDITDAYDAATMIHLTFDTVTSATGPVIDLSGELEEDIAKHPGPRGSALHSTGTDQSAHGASRVSPLNRSLQGTENTMAAIAEVDPALPDKVVANWLRVTGMSRRRIVNQYRRLIREAMKHPDYESWKYWYDDAHDISTKLADEHGFTTEQVAGAFAAFSPNVGWEEELKVIPHLVEMVAEDPAVTAEQAESINARLAADKVINGITEGTVVEYEPLEAGDRISKLTHPRAAAFAYVDLARTSELHQNWGLPSGYDPLADAVMLLRGAEPADVLRGVKTRSFYNNIIMPEDARDVTIDFQMMEAAARRPLHSKKIDKLPSYDGHIREEANTLAGTPSKKVRGSDQRATEIGVRPYLGDITRQVGAEFDLLPNQAQAIIWNQWKEEK